MPACPNTANEAFRIMLIVLANKVSRRIGWFFLTEMDTDWQN